MSIFKINEGYHLEQPMFFGEQVDIQRYEKVKYSAIDNYTKKQIGFFWVPDEADLSTDIGDSKKKLESHHMHLFRMNLLRQTMLDSVQGRAPTLAFGPICSLPEIESFLEAWTFSEMIHSRSYTHIVRNIIPKPSDMFDEIKTNTEILACANDVTVYYDTLIRFNAMRELKDSAYDEYEHKKALWKALHGVYALEAIRFFVSFACSWSMPESLNAMWGSAGIIKLISRDELVHKSFTSFLINRLPKDEPEYRDIQEECADEINDMFISVTDQEKQWADYLFSEGNMLGLNAKILQRYVEYMAGHSMRKIGMSDPYKIATDPLPWTQKWISGRGVQTANQETEGLTYIISGARRDLKTAKRDFEL